MFKQASALAIPPLKLLSSGWAIKLRLLQRHELDATYGENNWRPMPSFPVWQHDKWRLIDDGHFSGTNEATSMSRRVHTVRLEIVAAISRRFLCWRPQLLARAAALLIALYLLLAVEDEVSAYRWKPVAPADLWVSVRAF